jgi:hypothetical protein
LESCSLFKFANMILSTITLISLSIAFFCEATDNPSVLAYRELNAKLAQSYEKSISPKLGANEPIDVDITLYVLDYEICSKEKELLIDIYFRQKWIDERLVSNSGIDIVSGQEIADKIWIPDTFFPSVSSIKHFKYPTTNTFVKISPTGEVLMSQRFQSTVRCLRSSEEHKVLKCSLAIESYGHKSSDIHYKWAKGQDSIGIEVSQDTDDYKFTEYKAKEKTQQLPSGNYSNLEAEFSFAKIGRKNQRSMHFGF